MKNSFTFKSKVWVYPGMAAWRFLSLPKKEAKTIKNIFGDLAKGWGSLPVSVEIGETKWKTSIFPDKKRNTYLLPLKAQVRKRESIHDNQTITFKIEILI